MSSNSSKVPARFCAAPWLESVLYNDGSYRICSRNHRVFGDWRAESLEGVWAGTGLQEFRAKVAEGVYPDSDCAACHAAGTSQSLGRILGTPLTNSLRFLVLSYLITYEEYLYLQKISELFSLEAPDHANRVAEFEHQLKGLFFRFRLEGHGGHLSKLKKIQNIVSVIKDFSKGEAVPRVVGPFRQVQLIAKCNARCVMCPGKFTGEIENGGSIAPEELEQAMGRPEDIVDFFCNGSEFLLFKGWKEVAQKLRVGGVASLRLSTNGMLLTKGTAEYLVDQEVIGHLNISLNAGTKETLERVQKNVRWDRLIENVDYLVAYAEAKRVYFPMSFSFIVMRSNFHELPAFMRLAAEWKRACRTLDPHVMIMSLENAGEKDYRYFLYEEHPSLAPREEMVAAFREAAEIAEREKIVASLYNYGAIRTLPEFVAEGFPLPEFVHHAAADRENIEGRVRLKLGPFFEEEFLRAKQEIVQCFDRALLRQGTFPVGGELAAASACMAESVRRLAAQIFAEAGAVPEFANLFERFPEYALYHQDYSREWSNRLCLRLQQDLEVFQWEIFRAKFGHGREDLPDHFGEKYLAVPGRAPLERLALGSRVLGKDFRVWRLVFRADLLVYVESLEDGELLAAEHDFVIGAFLFDPAPDTRSMAFRKNRAKSYFHSELESKYVELLKLGRERIGALFSGEFEKIPATLARQLNEIRGETANEFVRHRRGLAKREVTEEIRAYFARFPDQEKIHERYRNRIERFCLAGLENELRQHELALFLERLKLSRQEVIDHFGKQYVGVGAERLSPGTPVLGADYQIWIFLRSRGEIVYLLPREGKGMQILPLGFLRGAFLFEDGPGEKELAEALRRADLHWNVNRFKRRIVGERKSRTLWHLSRAYRFGLRGLGIKTPTDLVIRQE